MHLMDEGPGAILSFKTFPSFINHLLEYTEELYKKNLHDPDNQDTVITHLEPDILEF